VIAPNSDCMQKDISVVIPLYNKEKYIQRTLDSVLNQTFQNFECIIIDSSNDGSTDIVRKYTDSRIRHVIRENRTYHTTARNIGVSMSQSALIAFIDADDEWTSDHLEVLVALSSHFPNAGLFATPYIKLRVDGSPMTMIFAGIPRLPWEGYLPRYFRICSQGDVPISSSSCAIRKKIFDEVGGFNENLIYRGEDQHLWGRVALQYPVAFTWRGPAIYHTEADERMCNEPHPLIGDPLSLHLRELMSRGLIEQDLILDVEAYIRRRQKTIWFSNLFCGSKLNKDDEADETQSRRLFVKDAVSQIGVFFSKCARIIYDSRFHNACRRMWCYLHGWYVPRLEG